MFGQFKTCLIRLCAITTSFFAQRDSIIWFSLLSISVDILLDLNEKILITFPYFLSVSSNIHKGHQRFLNHFYTHGETINNNKSVISGWEGLQRKSRLKLYFSATKGWGESSTDIIVFQPSDSTAIVSVDQEKRT